jgi:hypothetical protein
VSDIIQLHAPPFEPAAPTSLAALSRPLVREEASRCPNHCSPCPTCQADRDSAVAAAREEGRKEASGLGLRLSQLVEDALATHVARLERQQAELIGSALRAVLPRLADRALRETLAAELAQHAAKPLLADTALRLRKSPDLDLGPLPDSPRLDIQDDPALAPGRLVLAQGDARTTLDAQPVIDALMARLAEFDAPSHTQATQASEAQMPEQMTAEPSHDD